MLIWTRDVSRRPFDSFYRWSVLADLDELQRRPWPCVRGAPGEVVIGAVIFAAKYR
jgi:hypothetical protein